MYASKKMIDWHVLVRMLVELDVAMNGSVLEASVELLATVKAAEGLVVDSSLRQRAGQLCAEHDIQFFRKRSPTVLAVDVSESAILEFISIGTPGTLATVPLARERKTTRRSNLHRRLQALQEKRLQTGEPPGLTLVGRYRPTKGE